MGCLQFLLSLNSVSRARTTVSCRSCCCSYFTISRRLSTVEPMARLEVALALRSIALVVVAGAGPFLHLPFVQITRTLRSRFASLLIMSSQVCAPRGSRIRSG